MSSVARCQCLRPRVIRPRLILTSPNQVMSEVVNKSLDNNTDDDYWRVCLADTSCRSRRSWSPSVWGCRAGCSRAWGRSGWRWGRVRQGTAARCTAAAQTCTSGSARRHGSWCCAAGRTGCRRAAQRRGTGENGTWTDASASLQHQQQAAIVVWLHHCCHLVNNTENIDCGQVSACPTMTTTSVSVPVGGGIWPTN